MVEPGRRGVNEDETMPCGGMVHLVQKIVPELVGVKEYPWGSDQKRGSGGQWRVDHGSRPIRGVPFGAAPGGCEREQGRDEDDPRIVLGRGGQARARPRRCEPG